MNSRELCSAVEEQLFGLKIRGRALTDLISEEEIEGAALVVTRRIARGDTTYSIALIISDVLRDIFQKRPNAEFFIPCAKVIREVLGSLAPMKSDKKYYYVAFSHSGKSYTYDYDGDEPIEIGDRVVVPVGDCGEEKVGIVVEYDYIFVDDLNFDLSELKMIVKKVTMQAENAV